VTAGIRVPDRVAIEQTIVLPDSFLQAFPWIIRILLSATDCIQQADHCLHLPGGYQPRKFVARLSETCEARERQQRCIGFSMPPYYWANVDVCDGISGASRSQTNQNALARPLQVLCVVDEGTQESGVEQPHIC
jgi:hypothetical protein